MTYFLKKSNLKIGTYLQIYESFYDPERKGTAHRSYKAVGYVHELIHNGMEDPISFYKEEVSRLNQQLCWRIYTVSLRYFYANKKIVPLVTEL